MSMTFGICMEGVEAGFEALVKECALAFCELRPFCYVEIGVAGGFTLGAVSTVLARHLPTWSSVGIDLPAGGGLDLHSVRKQCAGRE